MTKGRTIDDEDENHLVGNTYDTVAFRLQKTTLVQMRAASQALVGSVMANASGIGHKLGPATTLATVPASPTKQSRTNEAQWAFEPGSVHYGDTRIPVTGIQRRLLERLAETRRPLLREDLEEAGWGDGEVEPGTLDKHLTELRKILREAFGLDQKKNPIPCKDQRENATWEMDF